MEWRGLINAILYIVQFDHDLDERVVDRIAHTLIEQPLLGLTPQQEYDTLVTALRSNELLTGGIPQPHSETIVGGFLAGTASRMETLRPWPVLPFVQLNVREWRRFGAARLIAQIHVWHLKVQERLCRGFDQVAAGRQVMLLRLQSGADIALVTPWWTGNDDLALLQNTPDRPPQQVLAEFIEATGFGVDEITPLWTRTHE